MENKKNTDRLINAIGTTAEMSLVFYRAAIGAGANLEEATRVTQAYIAAMAFGKGQGQNKDEKKKEGQTTA